MQTNDVSILEPRAADRERRGSPAPDAPAFGKGIGDRVLLLGEAALLTGLSTKTLKRMAAEDDGLKLFKVSPRRLAVMQSELQRWLSERQAQAA